MGLLVTFRFGSFGCRICIVVSATTSLTIRYVCILTLIIENLIKFKKMNSESAAPSPVGKDKYGNVDAMLERLMNIGRPNTGISTSINEKVYRGANYFLIFLWFKDITDLLIAIKALFLSQPMCLELNPPLYICGDIHGQYGDLMRLFNKVSY